MAATSPEDGQRKVFWLGKSRPTESDGQAFRDNKVTTSKYTYVNFVPKNVFEQLHKFGNCYFLAISVLMYIGEKTPLFIGTIKAFSTLATLLSMMGVSALVAWVDDRRRAAADAEINKAKAYVVSPDANSLQEKTWEDVAVGDVLVVKQGDGFPADVVPLYCCSEEGNCFVSTANLDGETNLKAKSALAETQSELKSSSGNLDSAEKAAERLLSKAADWQKASIDAEKPNVSIYTFSGKITLPAGSTKALGPDQLLLRGTILRNTKFVVGVVVYTGKDTRMVMNSRPPPMKQSNLERVINRVMYVVLAAQAVLALVSDVIYLVNRQHFENLWYLFPPELLLPDWSGYFLTFFVLYSNLMPISLYPTLEVCNAAQSYFIKNDLRMYHKDEDFDNIPAGVRASNLCQEIGQVKYIFSDKTGTLTQNVMELKRLSVKGKKYGSMQEDDKQNPSLADVRSTSDENMDTFLEVLSLCHTAVAAEGDGGKLRYEAESPDEVALVAGAQTLGWEFTSRFRQDAVVSKQRGGSSGELKYVIHGINEFNSTRKRMSAIVQDPSGSYFLFMKGADNVMMERATQGGYDYTSDLSEFSREGLRTLLFGRKSLTKDEFTTWCAKYEAARQQVVGREDALDKVAADIEKEVDLVGVTAIEDKLQVGVPEAIELIRQAGIKLWVLTGDKLETARNIGFSAKVLTDEMLIKVIDTERSASSEEVKKVLVETVSSFKDEKEKKKACLVTGAALESITSNEESKKLLLEIAELCSIVIACRVSPLQKAEMVKLVKDDGASRGKEPITLAIGDGANDVPMIQEAQVGVGIAGREGRQAVNNSDFSIGQFRFLGRLLLVHGRWNYRRVCKFTLFTFWRNAVQVLMTFFYTFSSGYSGTSLFEDWIRLSFNFLCSVPIMATGCFDQDLPDKVVSKHPELYQVGVQGMDLTPRLMMETFVSASIHSLSLLALTTGIAPAMDLLGAGDYYTYGTAAYTLLLINTNVRVMALNYTHNIFTVGSFVLSFFLYIVYLLLYPCQHLIAQLLAPNMYMVPWHMVKSAPFWISVFAVPAVAMTMDMVIQLIYVYSHKHGAMRTRVIYRIRNKYFEGETANDIQGVASGALGSFRPGSTKVFPSSKCPLLLLPSKMCPSRSLHQDLNPPVSGTAFAQQKHRGWHLGHPERFVCIFSIVAAIYLGVAGSIWMAMSSNVQQIRIHYAGETGFDSPSTRPQEVVFAHNDCNLGEKCEVILTVPADMKDPVAYYEIKPFYQNHNFYLKSELVQELMGQDVTDEMRERLCIQKQTRIDSNGNDIVPCGMKATSMFNDTFDVKSPSGHQGKLIAMPLDTEGTAWEEDGARYRNPKDYLHRDHTTWLYETYNKIPGLKEEGVENERFQVWMRPSAFPTVTNPIGRFNRSLIKGEVLHINIGSYFPLPSEDGYKVLVLTELTSLGGRSDFGERLLLAAFVCLLGGLASYCLVTIRPDTDEDFKDEVPSLVEHADGYESDREPFPLPRGSGSEAQGGSSSESQPLLCGGECPC